MNACIIYVKTLRNTIVVGCRLLGTITLFRTCLHMV